MIFIKPKCKNLSSKMVWISLPKWQINQLESNTKNKANGIPKIITILKPISGWKEWEITNSKDTGRVNENGQLV